MQGEQLLNYFYNVKKKKKTTNVVASITQFVVCTLFLKDKFQVFFFFFFLGKKFQVDIKIIIGSQIDTN